MVLPLSLAGGAISAVGGLLGGLSAKSEARKARERQLGMFLEGLRAADEARATPLEHWTETKEGSTSTSTTAGDVDFQGFVRDASAAGFNPLSAMRAGLGSYYSRSTTLGSTSGFSSTYEKTLGQNANSKVDFIAAAMGAPVATANADPWSGLFNALGSSISQYGRDVEDQQFQLAKQNAYLNAITGGSATKANGIGSVPWSVSTGSNPAANQAARSLITPFGGRVDLPNSSPAQKVEDEFSDWAGGAYGIWRAIETALMPSNLYRWGLENSGSEAVAKAISKPLDLSFQGLAGYAKSAWDAATAQDLARQKIILKNEGEYNRVVEQ